MNFANEHLLKSQLKFLIRIQDNNYTNKLTRSLFENDGSNGLINMIKEKLNIENYEELVAKCETEINKIENLKIDRLNHCYKSKNCAAIMYDEKISIHKRRNILTNILYYN